MTKEEAIAILQKIKPIPRRVDSKSTTHILKTIALDMAIQALDQKPRKDEIILTKEEYRELVSSEFDNGYAKGYREALEQEPILDKIRAEIDSLHNGCGLFNDGINKALDIIDKYKAESEVEE